MTSNSTDLQGGLQDGHMPRRKPMTQHEEMVKKLHDGQSYARSTSRANGNDVFRIEKKLDKIISLLEKTK